TAALWLLDRRPTLAGMALGMAFNIKYLPIVLLPYLMMRRRYAATAGFIAGAVGFALLPALNTGWDTNLANLATAYGGLLRMVGVVSPSAPVAHVEDITDGLSVSITSGFARLGLAPLAALAAAVGVGLISLFWASRVYRRRGFAFWYRPDGFCH